MYELLIKNATVIDGTGKPGFAAAVACESGKLKVLSPDCDCEAAKVIDGSGLYLTPGFIDPHSHGDVPLGRHFNSVSKLSQGITTHVTGQCGFSMFPVDPARLKPMQDGMAIFTDSFPAEMETFTSFENYLKYVSTLKLPENVKFNVGHVSLRIAAMGFDNRKPTAEELEKMKSMLREAMEHGAIGLSSGLIYIPSVYADTEEFVELCKVVAEYDGIYTTHMRNEGDDVLKSIEESIEVGRRSGCRVHISHLKVCGQKNWGLSKKIVEMIKQAQKEGIRVSADQYPYTASMTHLNVCIPPKYFTKGIPGMVELLKDPAMRQQIKMEMMDPDTHFENQYINCGGFDGVFVSRCAETPEYEGMTIGEAARKHDMDPFDLFFDLLIRNKGVASAIYFCMGEEDVFNIIQCDSVVPGTDGIVKSESERAHPRAYGTMPRAIRWFVKENHLMPLEAMIHKMTGQAAQLCMIEGKGVIADGMDADLVLFNYDTICDTADFMESSRLAEGIEYVIVGGEVVYHAKQLTGATPGRVILHGKR